MFIYLSPEILKDRRNHLSNIGVFLARLDAHTRKHVYT